MDRPPRPRLALLLLAATLSACATSAGRETPPAPSGEGGDGGELTVVAVGLAAAARGEVLFALFDSAGAFAAGEGAVATGAAEVSGGAATWSASGVPPGRYAVKAFHDADADGELDFHPLGFPSEPYGFSNDARARFGPPRFAAAAFDWPGGAATVVVRLR